MSRFQSPTSVLVLLVAFYSTAVSGAYVNTWDQQFQYECPEGEVLRSVLSVHSDTAEDRRWMFTCGAAPSGASPSFCRWTSDYVNNWDEPINFMCPADFVLTGVSSYHSNAAEDRRMKFKCCKDAAYKTASCSLTPYLNNWDSLLTYNVAFSKVLVGWFSVHSNGAEDRRHKMLVCRYNHVN
ncbi:hemagglutinin/amebocyte aggregation factor [Elysia marginata]|uniref:Hemagglutinin/amebocyte aggregation factor n=1 Tax=Elysia marginata TaxID=1093978 RepID=A0AAV4HBF8_9GAST|nr:hemagglutinin/amebocyte aggregation factor [Elysia marginata]